MFWEILGLKDRYNLNISVFASLTSSVIFQDFEYGTTEVLDRGALAARLKELFRALQESKSTPTILLIHDQEVTKSVLDCAGVDLSCCQMGILNLLHHNAVEVISFMYCCNWE